MSEIALMAHLLRRAGFGASRDELEACAARGYEAVVEDLLHPERFPEVEDDLIGRYNHGVLLQASIEGEAQRWFYRMINTRRPLQEKIALFWHHVFATAWYKTEHNPDMVRQIDMFREVGLSRFRTILARLSRDPAMLDWLDNQENHKDEPNENYARELLELFSMGVGNYTENDVKNAGLSFTGWSFIQPIPGYPYGQYMSGFAYRPDDHDDSVKTFLGGDRTLRRRGHSRDHSQTARDGGVRVAPPVQLLRRRRAPGAVLGAKSRPATLPPSTRWRRRTFSRTGRSGRSWACCFAPTSSRGPPSSG